MVCAELISSSQWGSTNVQVGSRLLLVKPLCKRLSSSISLSASSRSKNWDDCDDFLDFQPKCMSLGRSRRWVFSQFDERARRKQHMICFACVLHIWECHLTTCNYVQTSQIFWDGFAVFFILVGTFYLHSRSSPDCLCFWEYDNRAMTTSDHACNQTRACHMSLG